MEWLNYHHLLYFWTVAKKGSVVAACQELKLRQPTVSAQIQELESNLGEKLFNRVGKKLILTEVGATVFKYADQIFSLGSELVSVVKDRPINNVYPLTVGVADVVPKIIAQKLLSNVFNIAEKVKLTCIEASAETLLSSMAIHQLDMVITDCPIPPGLGIKGYNHLLGESGTSFLAAKIVIEKLNGEFPFCLNNAPLLLPTYESAIRIQIDQFFASKDINIEIKCEFDDSALLKLFGSQGIGVFCVPTAIEKDVIKTFDVKLVGRTNSITEKFYLISSQKKIKNPGGLALIEAAKNFLL